MNQHQFNRLVYLAAMYFEKADLNIRTQLCNDYAFICSVIGHTEQRAIDEIFTLFTEATNKVNANESDEDDITLFIRYFSDELNTKWQIAFQYTDEEMPVRQTFVPNAMELNPISPLFKDSDPEQVNLSTEEDTEESEISLIPRTDSHRDVVIVGAGPVGLAFAIGLKKLNKALQIRVYEKYEEYQRKHTLEVLHEQVENYIREAGLKGDAEMEGLLDILKSDPNIRTNTLEEILKNKALALEVEIVVEEIKEEKIRQQIGRHAPRFVVGADGTHSVVSRTLFDPDNQVKHEFDFVLQLRYEIKGEARADRLEPVKFYEQMAQDGIIASEYVGTYDAAKGTTPITMQMMISREEFNRLSPIATSKNPVYLYKNTPNASPLPRPIASFLGNYMQKKISSTKNQEEIIRESVRVSVNEAPATHAKQVYKVEQDGTIIHLKGDAALGLSYFKGINAAFQNLGEWFKRMAPSVKKGLPVNDDEMLSALASYQDWFLSDFAPRKVKEVEKYSTWKIRAPMTFMKTVHSLANASEVTIDDDKKPLAEQYFNAILGGDYMINRRLYPHRDYDPVKLWQWSYVPVSHSLKKVWKLVVDYVKPYKSTGQLKQDFRQPLVGTANILIGSSKILVGFFQMFTLNFKRFGDGLFTFGRGLFEIVTTPLAWTLKPVIRGIVTGLHYVWRGPKRIEDNDGMRKLAKTGLDYVNELEGDALDPVVKRDVLGYCNDLHRKFIKSHSRGQNTLIEQNESEQYLKITGDSDNLRSVATNYFSLFNARSASLPVKKPRDSNSSNLSVTL